MAKIFDMHGKHRYLVTLFLYLNGQISTLKGGFATLSDGVIDPIKALNSPLCKRLDGPKFTFSMHIPATQRRIRPGVW